MERTRKTLIPQIRKRFERALEEALHFKGQSAGSPKVMLEISDVQYLLKWLDFENDERLPWWVDKDCGACGGSGYTSLGGCYMCQKKKHE